MPDMNTLRCLTLLWLALMAGFPAFADDETGKQVQLIANTLEHGTFDIADKRGKLVLIAVWATWCPICLGELPELDRIYRKYHAAGFEMLALNIDDDDARVTDYLRKKGFAFPVARRNGRDIIENLNNLGVTPVFYLVGKDGKVIWRRVGPVAGMFGE